VADLLRLDQAFLTGKILSKRLQAVLATPYVSTSDAMFFAGYGTWLSKADRLPLCAANTGCTLAPFKAHRTLSQGSGGPDPSGYALFNDLSPDDGAIAIDLNNDTGYFPHDDNDVFLEQLARLMWAR
jgi:hypothetical protein